MVFALIQVAFLPEFLIGARTPNLVMAFAFAVLIMDVQDDALLTAFIGGLFLDFLGFSVPGLSSLIMVGFLGVAFFVRKYVFRAWWSVGVLVFVSHFAYVLILNLPRFYPPGGALLGAVLTTLSTLLLYRFTGNLIKRLSDTGYKIQVP